VSDHSWLLWAIKAVKGEGCENEAASAWAELDALVADRERLTRRVEELEAGDDRSAVASEGGKTIRDAIAQRDHRYKLAGTAEGQYIHDADGCEKCAGLSALADLERDRERLTAALRDLISHHHSDCACDLCIAAREALRERP
jgi:hypothetical protein